MRRLSFLIIGCVLSAGLSGCGGGNGGNNGSDSATANADKYPLVLGIAPAQGKLAGGDTITITGRYFTKRANNSAVTVRLGSDVPGTVVNDTTMTFVTPSGAPLVQPGLPAPQIRVQVILDSRISSGATGSNDPLFTYNP